MAHTTDAMDREQLRDLLLACVFLAEEHLSGRLGSVENQDLLTQTRAALASQGVREALRERLESMPLAPQQRQEAEQVIAELSSGMAPASEASLAGVQQSLQRARQAREEGLLPPESMDSLMLELQTLSRQVDQLLEEAEEDGKPRG